LILGDTDEIEGIAFKCAEFAAQELKEYDDMKMFKMDYENWKKGYEGDYPSEALKKSRSYGSLPRINNRY
jgi:hypothetical protein